MERRDTDSMRPKDVFLKSTSLPLGVRMSDAELEIAWLILNNPVEYDRRLASYFRLLGEDRPWWRLCAESDDPRWASCVRRAIETMAREQVISQRKMADYLDGEAFPRAKHRVLEIARKMLHDEGGA